MGESNHKPETPTQKVQDDNEGVLFSKVKALVVNASIAFAVTLASTLIIVIIGILPDVTSIAALASPSVESMRPAIQLTLGVIVFLYGSEIFIQWRLKDKRQKAKRLLTKEKEFFAVIESDFSRLLQER